MTQQITLKGNATDVDGQLPSPGDSLAEFSLTGANLRDVTLADFAGKRKIFNIFPSMDTPTCAISVKRFNAEVDALDNIALLQVSADLPFAHSRFCTAEGLENGTTLSMMRDKRFAKDYGVLIANGPMAGLCARAVIVADEQGMVLHSELVPEIGQEPNYEDALAALKV
ncbi:lipid hydroperoxide peroxidase [Salinisphaera sp. C84B14]|uniref:thiol peroxidase n=1 Tax=Salinisphaera sp. C84B14 TaxID=1304155 RepID=UPI00333F5EEC